MDRSPFDFDVVTGPPPPRPQTSPQKDSGEKPDASAPPAPGETAAAS